MFAPEEKLRDYYSELNFGIESTEYWINEYRPFFGKILVITEIRTNELVRASHKHQSATDIDYRELILIQRGD